MMKLIDQLPGLYATFFDPWFDDLIPDESLATCTNCAMCKKEGEIELPVSNYFSPDTKCCTYQPYLPNYLVGAILSDTSSQMDEGRMRIQSKIKNRIGITPQGIFPSKNYSNLFQNKGNGFGKNESLLCPYYENGTGNCTVWQYRASLCSTWFCKYIAGEDGRLFWEALKDYLYIVQDELCEYALQELDIDTKVDQDHVMKSLIGDVEFESMPATDLDELAASSEYYNKLWLDWEGREEALYMKSYEIVRNISPAVFNQITGEQGLAELERVKKRKNQVLYPDLPDVLMKNPKLKVHKIDSQSLAVRSVSVYIKVSVQLYDILEYFNGSNTNEEIIQQVGIQKSMLIQKDLLVSLFQNRILVNPDKLNDPIINSGN